VWTPLEPVALLPIPGGAFADFGPFEPILQIDVSNVTAVIRLYVTALKVNAQTEQVPVTAIELKHLVKEKARIRSTVRLWAWIGNTCNRRVARISGFEHLIEIRIDGIREILLSGGAGAERDQES